MKIIYGLFLSLFVLLCLCPLVGMWILGPSEAAANEILAQAPELRGEDGSWNLDYLSDASDYLCDRFAGRQVLITANARVESTLLGESANEDVILGKNGWLFYASTMDDYRRENCMSERELFAAAHNLQMVQSYAQEQGATFLFTIVPNKNTLYSEYMPERPGEGEGNREALCRALEQEGISFLDLTPTFAEQEQVLYHRLDSHWTKLGAALAGDTILSALGRTASAYEPVQFNAVKSHDGDLYAMLYPAGTEKDLQYEPMNSFHYEYTKPLRSVEDQMILTACEKGQGSLFMFRDSFGNTLHSFMAEQFATASFSKAMPYDLGQAALQDGTVLAVELVERNLPWLSSRPPLLPAPRCRMELPAEATMPEFPVELTVDGSGRTRLSGELPVTPDADAPIWLACDGQVYEACLRGENGFSAILETAPETLQIMTLCDGTACLSQPVEIINE